jgi:hypothetical protein
VATKKRSSNKGPGSDFGSLGKMKQPSNKGQTKSQKVAAQVWNRLNPPVPSNVQQGAAGNWRAAVGKAASNFIRPTVRAIGNQLGDDAFEGMVRNITNKPFNMGNKIKGTRSTIYTPEGAFQGKGAFLQTPARTPEQIAGTIKGQITKAEKEAAKIAAAGRQGAATGAKIYGTAGLIGGAAGGSAITYQIVKPRNGGTKTRGSKSVSNKKK